MNTVPNDGDTDWILSRLRSCVEDMRDAKEDRLWLIQEARRNGITYRAIATQLGMTAPAVIDILNRSDSK